MKTTLPFCRGTNVLAAILFVVAGSVYAEPVAPLPYYDAHSRQEFAQLSADIPEPAAILPSPPPVNPGLEFGYDKGFVIGSPKGAKHGAGGVPFAMKINSWFQLRHTVFDSDGPNPDQNDIEFERVRLTFGGHAYTPELKYFIQLDGDSDAGEVADWLDYYITYDIGHGAWGCEKGRLGIKAGKWKLPYSRARAESGWKMQFADRSLASSFFDINRSLGVALFGKVDFFGRTMNWESAVVNGFTTGGFRPVRSGDLDRNFGYATRVWSDWVGEWGKDGEADLSFHEMPAIRVGAGFAYTRVDDEGTREFDRQRVVDSGALLSSILPAGVSEYDVFFYAADFNLKFRGFSLLSEYYVRCLANFNGGAVDDLFDHGFLVQSGYFVVHETLELLARWSHIEGNSGTLGAVDAGADEFAAGAVWYIKGQLAKITFDVTHLNGSPTRDPALNILNGDAGWMYRTQFQLRF